MEIKQHTIAEIVETEGLLVANAHERYPVYYPHALEASLFLTNFVKSVDADRSIFAMFLSQVKKHHTLALFSTVRLHQIQAKMNLRQVLEAGASAAFAIANPGPENFVDADDQGILDPPGLAASGVSEDRGIPILFLLGVPGLSPRPRKARRTVLADIKLAAFEMDHGCSPIASPAGGE